MLDLAKKQTTRNVYRCHVIGPRDAGKTTFCQGILGRSKQVLKRQYVISSFEPMKITIKTIRAFSGSLEYPIE